MEEEEEEEKSQNENLHGGIASCFPNHLGLCLL
jgi:hypothetical protein